MFFFFFLYLGNTEQSTTQDLNNLKPFWITESKSPTPPPLRAPPQCTCPAEPFLFLPFLFSFDSATLHHTCNTHVNTIMVNGLFIGETNAKSVVKGTHWAINCGVTEFQIMELKITKTRRSKDNNKNKNNNTKMSISLDTFSE